MGAHHSTQSLKTSTSLFTQATIDVVQNCITYLSGDQIIDIHGDGNIFNGNVQRASLSINSKCVDSISQKGNFVESLADKVAQELNKKDVALTQWMDPGGENQASDIRESIKNNIKISDVQECLARLNGEQLFIISGSDNIIQNNLQDQTMNLAKQCLMSGSQTADTMNHITNSINQHSTHITDSPFAFITDAIKSVFSSSIYVAAFVFIIIIIFVSIGIFTHHSGPAIDSTLDRSEDNK